MEIASFVLSVIAVLTAGASALYTRRQAAEAGKVTAIEQQRFHADQTPQIALKCEARDPDGHQAELMLELTGPMALDRLDQVTVRIRDDQPRQPTPGSLQQEEHWEEVIWGRYRIRPGLRDTDPNGRAHGPFRLPKNEPYPIPLGQSIAPPWQTDWQSWRDQYRGAPVRLEITCVRDGYQPWVLTPEIKVRFPPHLMMQRPGG
jgi:hypothetical protein